MISLTGNSDQVKVGAAILPETISEGAGSARDVEDLRGGQEFRHRQYLPHTAQATVGAVIPSKFEPMWLV
ncbi:MULTISPECIES: hypothetical protein [Bradyrhizobium]|uniref:Uncharacterized protein n=4 Tax=Bradyrhizobium TaxID=374 RepID=A0ACD3VLZ9_9BRAD|nr:MULTISPECIES: hypothetical protein [Bradyrhizobium]MCK7664900.1 hypothetical protein [Bradyrhizobium sp. 2S1]UFX49354.1 hypothetical protein HAP47_0041215 [Bradyrhizobium sp. 41S5]UGY07506.1 hypothetical protein J4P68_0040900 [Bradyrhizobium quebecense]UPT92190.1 hypothetical protein HAP41_0000048935 [Bradyrhizobium barranii subsp. apii]UPU01421.1 hypothetical protein J4G48_0049425 [Bradyrhizobium barranii subsp. apii]